MNDNKSDGYSDQEFELIKEKYEKLNQTT